MSGLTKNKLSNQSLRTLLKRINERPTILSREFEVDRGTIYYYRKKLRLANGKISVLIENKQREWRPRITNIAPTLTLKKLKEFTEEICRPEKCYADYLQDEENKKNRKIERLFTNHKIK